MLPDRRRDLEPPHRGIGSRPLSGQARGAESSGASAARGRGLRRSPRAARARGAWPIARALSVREAAARLPGSRSSSRHPEGRGGKVAQEIGIAVVGTGDWGANLVRNFAALPGARLTRLCDSDADRLERTAAKYPQARPAARVEEVAADPEVQAAVVSSSAVHHHPLARTLLLAGKDVFVEKPLALSV
ncbi:MAG: hypothetical protein E6K80_11300, partial [Candidatus Eisenbacteria bacterium]